MSAPNCVEGEVWINNKKVLNKVYPYICSEGFWFHNKSNNWGEGPHIEIVVTPDQFSGALANFKSQEPLLSLSQGYLGHIDQLSGYASAGQSSDSRLIESVTIQLERPLGRSNFEISGIAAASNAKSLSPFPFNDGGPFNFKVLFSAKDSDLSLYFRNPIYLKAMHAFIERFPS